MDPQHRYFALPGSPITNAQANELGTRFELLAQKGPLTPKAIVDDARPMESPTHSYFEWDDAEAAERWRIQQARIYTCSIQVVVASLSEPVKAFHSVLVQVDQTRKGEPVFQRGYVPIEQIAKEEDLLEQVREEARKHLITARRQLSQISKLEKARDAVQQALEILDTA